MSHLSVLFLLTSSFLSAQSHLGTITGTITDSQTARVPGAEIVAKQTATNLTFKTTSSEDGTYTIPNLPVGPYSITASAQGFKTFTRSGLVLEVSMRMRVDIALEVGAVNESVTVSAETSRVQTE